MVKGKWFLSCLLSAAMVFSPLSGIMLGAGTTVLAEDEYYEEEYYDEGDYSEGSDSYEEENHDSGDSSKEEEYHFERDPHVDTNEIAGWPQGDGVDADCAVLMDADTGAILYGKYIDEQKYPASITKIMTVLLALENGNLDDVVKFSEYAVYSIEFGSAHLGLKEGEELTLEQCLYGIMMASANEISNAVAEHIGGDVETFADMMNAKAEELGCKNTYFVNPNGLHEDDHYVCARDMALIMQEALKYDKFREIIHTTEYHYPPTNLEKEDRYFVNHHSFLMDDSYEGIIGGKTGFTDQAFNTLVTAAERDGMTLISVVLHAPGIDSEYGDTRTILDYGFDNFENVELENAKQAKINLTIDNVEDQAELGKIKEADFTQAPFTFPETTKVTLPKEADLSEVKAEMDFANNEITYTYKDQVIGKDTFEYTGEWEPETESETEIVTEASTEAVTESAAVSGEDSRLVQTILTGLQGAVEKINTLIAHHDLIAVGIGAALLIIFIPLLIVAISRNRRHKKIMQARVKELEERRRRAAEIERQSAVQVAEELQARDLAFFREQKPANEKKDTEE